MGSAGSVTQRSQQEEPCPPLRMRPGEVRQGAIVHERPEGLVVEVDGLEGLVPREDLERLDEETRHSLVPGRQVSLYVLHPRDDESPLFSISRAQVAEDWRRAQEMAARGELWEAEVVGCNRGGLVVPFGRIQAFVPASQVTGIQRSSTPAEKRRQLRALVSQRLWFKVMEVDQARGRLVLSERLGRRQYRQRRKAELVQTLQEGDVVKGVVTSLCDFGAFVDLGGADGLIHVSEIAWGTVEHPSEHLQVGDEVEAVVLRVDRQQGRIGLSLKRCQPDPWDTVPQRYREGQLVEGVVTRLASFGAFVEVEPGVEGLVHISELTDGVILDPVEVVDEGEPLLLRVIRVDASARRLGLSLRRVTNEEWAEWARRKRAEQAEASAGDEDEEA
ncbi:MAG: S1 RNA-binding domain-containing protein [Anaerolineae bacterium]|nr:S1 RNA-binding domain-containing protein [Anaerolineae bacterium]